MTTVVFSSCETCPWLKDVRGFLAQCGETYTSKASLDLLVSTYLVCERLLWSNSKFAWLTFWFKFRKVPTFPDFSSESPPPPPPEMKIVRDFRFEVTKVRLVKSPPPPPWNSKIADLDRLAKVRKSMEKYPPPPPENSKIADLDRLAKVRKSTEKFPPPPDWPKLGKVGPDQNGMWRLHLYPRWLTLV